MPSGIYKRKPRAQWVKDKISKSLKGIKRKPFTKEHRAAISKSCKGKKMGCLNPRWNTGNLKHGPGYVFLRMPGHRLADSNGYVLEHRYIMEKHLNRPLSSKEVIHHKNGRYDDNRIKI